MLNLSISSASSPDAEALGKAYLLFLENINRISSFRKVAIAGRETGAVTAHEQFMIEMSNSALKSLMGENQEEMIAQMKPLLLERMRSDSTASSDAACLILAHSVFEALVHDLLDILESVRRADIINIIGKRQIPICDLKDGNLDELITAEVRRYISELTHESLSKNIAFIFNCCKFDKNSQEPGYSYDEKQLLAIDKKRQDIIHKAIFGQPILEIESILMFLQNTGDYLVSRVSNGTGLEVNVRNAVQSLAKHFEYGPNALRTVGTLIDSVNGFIERWLLWGATHQATQDQHDQVKTLFEDWQKTMRAVRELMLELTKNRFASHIELDDAMMKADNTAQTMIRLIELFMSGGQSAAVEEKTEVQQ